MDIHRFWKIIDASREKASGDAETQLAALRESLELLAPEDVAAFAEHFDTCDVIAYRWDLWAAAYILNGGCSDDAFTDFRASLICRGHDVFERAVSHPDSLADLTLDDAENDLFFEGFQYIPGEVYEAKTGRDLPPRKTPFPTDPEGSEWEDEADDLKKICPQLWQKHSWKDT